MAYFIDATGITGTGATTGTVYTAASGQANATRPFATNDTLKVDHAVLPEDGWRFPASRARMLLTLNVTADPVTHAVTAVTSNIGDFVP